MAGTGATTLGVATELPAQTTNPATFVRSGPKYELRRGVQALWTVDSRWFDLTQGGRIAVEAGGQRLVISGFLGGANIAVELTVTINGDALAFSSSGAKASVPIDDWTDHRAGVGVRFRVLPHDNAAVRLGRSNSSVATTLSAPFNFRIDAPFSYEGEECGSGRTASAAFVPSTDGSPADADVDRILKNARPLGTLTLSGIELDQPGRGWELGSVGGRVLRLVFPQGSGTIVLEQVLLGTRRHVLRLKGPSARQPGARLRYGDQSYGREVHVGIVELVRVVGGTRAQHGLRIGRSERASYVEADRYSAAIRLKDGDFIPSFSGRPLIEIPIELFVLHARGEDSTRFEADFRTIAWDESGPVLVGAPGLNRSSPVWSTEGTHGVDATLSIGVRRQALAPNWLHLGQDDGAAVWMHRPGATGLRVDSPVLRLRRAFDALDVGLMFYNFRLEVGDAARLVSVKGATRGIRFNPQHLEEECFSAPKATGLLAR